MSLATGLVRVRCGYGRYGFGAARATEALERSCHGGRAARISPAAKSPGGIAGSHHSFAIEEAA